MKRMKYIAVNIAKRNMAANINPCLAYPRQGFMYSKEMSKCVPAREIISSQERSRYGDNAAVLNSPSGSLSAGVIHVLVKT